MLLIELIALFEGKKVHITHTNQRTRNAMGVCKKVHATPGSLTPFDLELMNGVRFGFDPEVTTPTSVDGKLHAFAGGRRKIELVE